MTPPTDKRTLSAGLAMATILGATMVAGAQLPAARRPVRPMVKNDEAEALGELLAADPRADEERLAYAQRQRELKGKRRAERHAKAIGCTVKQLPRPKKLTKKQKRARASVAIKKGRRG